MKIDVNKNYNVDLYTKGGDDRSYGILPGSDVKSMLRGCKYDEDFGMWFTPRANKAYDVQEIDD